MNGLQAPTNVQVNDKSPQETASSVIIVEPIESASAEDGHIDDKVNEPSKPIPQKRGRKVKPVPSASTSKVDKVEKPPKAVPPEKRGRVPKTHKVDKPLKSPPKKKNVRSLKPQPAPKETHSFDDSLESSVENSTLLVWAKDFEYSAMN